MVDTGQWWFGIIQKIKGEDGTGVGISESELQSDAQQRINQLQSAIQIEDWNEAQRNAKNIIIYEKLIKLDRDLIEADAKRIGDEWGPEIDAEFDPLVQDGITAETINTAIEHFIPAGVGGGKSRKRKSRRLKSRKLKSRKRKSSKRKSRKRKSRGRKSRGRKSKRRNR